MIKIYNYNQITIQMGVYPHDMKLAKAIALYKKVRGMVQINITWSASCQFLAK